MPFAKYRPLKTVGTRAIRSAFPSPTRTPDSKWRNRVEFITGREQIIEFLTRKWNRELDYRLIKEVWAFSADRIAVCFAYEWHDNSGQWYRSYGNEKWEFDEAGLMKTRHASINDLTIQEEQRLYRWPTGQRPDNHPGLSALGLQRPGRIVAPQALNGQSMRKQT